MMRKGQGISINVIVIAAIALLILVILSTLVLRSGTKINQGASTCEALGAPNVDYTCPAQVDGCPDGFIRDTTRACSQSAPDNPLLCCRKL